MPQPFQFVGQLAHAFGGPAPWRLRSASGRRFDTTLQVRTKRLISLDGALASSTRSADAARGLLQGSDLPRRQEFSATGSDGGRRNSSGLGNHGGPSVAQGQRLGANVEPKAPLVQQRIEPWISFSDRLSLHVPSITWWRRMQRLFCTGY